MRGLIQNARLILLSCAAATLTATAQPARESSAKVHPDSPKGPSLRRTPAANLRLLSLDDGLAVLGAALDFRRLSVSRSDCSHLVHEVYERAGFPYEYASSSELYAGANAFQRVISPQAGDLAVWQGHVGIVISPLQHSFFSLLRSGPGVDSYDAPYWKERGSPHFFRYVRASPDAFAIHQIRRANLKPAGNSEVPVSDDPPSVRSEAFAGESAPTVKPAGPETRGTLAPNVVVVHAVRPQLDQVRDAFSQTLKTGEESLRGADLLNLSQPLLAFERFEIKKIHIKGSEGWVDVRIEKPVLLTALKMEAHERAEHQRWPLKRRDQESWELATGPNTIYLTRSAFVRLLAKQLVQLSEAPSGTAAKAQREAQLAHLLDLLLRK